MKLKLVLPALASLIIATTAQAQLGWTLEQCKAKFNGTPEIEKLYDQRIRATFSNPDYQVILDFSGGGKVSSLLFSPNHDNEAGGFKNIIKEVVVVSSEVASWYQSYVNGVKASNGISWTENETLSDKDGAYFVGTKGGHVAMSLLVDPRGGLTIETQTSTGLKEDIAEAKKQNEAEDYQRAYKFGQELRRVIDSMDPQNKK